MHFKFQIALDLYFGGVASILSWSS